MLSKSPPPRRTETLRWLALLRWAAVAGQTSAMIFSAAVLKFELPWLPLLGGVILTSFSNHWLPEVAGQRAKAGERRVGLAIAGDVLLLTWMLHWAGGAHNPFTVFFLLHLVLAAMLLEARGLGFVAGLVGVCFALVSFFRVPFRGPERWVADGHLKYPLHQAACAVALVLAGSALALLVHRMRRAQVASNRERAAAELKTADAERFKSLATLAAGVAHEMGTPLGTIAVVSKDLERALGEKVVDPATLDDARLIRSEVERCRGILKRLDLRTTGGTGSPSEAFRSGELGALVAARLPAGMKERLEYRDHAGNAEVRLVLQPLLQALVVLIENACEADPSGRPVALETRPEAGGRLAFRVLDRGRGMSEAVRRRVGEPYFTTKSKDGTGLGLFLVRTLMLDLGGEVSLMPRPDGGTSATLTLPLSQPP